MTVSPARVSSQFPPRSEGSDIDDHRARRELRAHTPQKNHKEWPRLVQRLGRWNLPSKAPYHASQMYATNVVNLLKLMINKEGALKIQLGR